MEIRNTQEMMPLLPAGESVGTMAHPWINRKFYEAILRFEESDEAQEYYYQIMDTEARDGTRVRDQILRAYAMLFCEDVGAVAGQPATPQNVEETADRLYIGEPGFDPEHWYRMRYHFPVIDEDTYDRFAALVIADLNAGFLHDAAKEEGEMLLVGALNPLLLSAEERAHQNLRAVQLPEREREGGEA